MQLAYCIRMLLLVSCCCFSQLTTVRADADYDVVIYGGTPGGIAAAVSAGRLGHSVIIVEPYQRIGGMLTNGLSHADFRTFEGLTGFYLELTQLTEQWYQTKYGKNSPQADCFRGTHAEPHVNQLALETMLADISGLKILTGTVLQTVNFEPQQSEPSSQIKIASLSVRSRSTELLTLTGKLFIDATYEGDLLAAAGMKYRVGREGREEFQESLAPEVGDDQLQGYNFRFIMTQDPQNLVLAAAPAGYLRENYLPLLNLFAEKKLNSVFCAPTGGIYKYQPPQLPNGKYDINDVSRGLVRLSLPQFNNDWPAGNAEVRAKIFQQHLQHQVGMLYFLQHDPEVPADIQKEARSWGFCKDEFPNTQHLPEQLYVREGRRLVGQYIFSQQDTNYEGSDVRCVYRSAAIAIGDYGPNCHGTDHQGSLYGGEHTGEFYQQVPPYQIPYGTIVPLSCQNLLVPVACSATHVGFCALRLEPIWCSLGEAAGVASHVAISKKVPVQELDVRLIQRQLHRQGSATIYLSDVLPGDTDFAAVQWWGSLGGWHGLRERMPRSKPRGENFFGQYFNAFHHHAAELERDLDDTTFQLWSDLAVKHGLITNRKRAATRGEWLRDIYQMNP